jgi:hypothetical protein
MVSPELRGGAVATHVHANDGMVFVPVIVGVVAWLGLYLRDRKLRALVPLVAESVSVNSRTA